MSVLVTGGAGYIGSHTVVELLKKNHDVVIVDNFVNSSPKVLDRISSIANDKFKFYEVDVTDMAELKKVFETEKIDSIIHFAGLKAVGESCEKPLSYYQNNLISTLNLIECMGIYGVKDFVFSSSATVYGAPKEVPIKETADLSVTNPYGRTKLMIEKILIDCAKVNKDFNIALLRYFNPIGAHESGMIGENPNGIPNNLMPYITQVSVGKLKQLNVFGNDYATVDGTGVRDYIHVVDLAKGHLLALDKLKTNSGLVIYNLGTGKGYSVLEIVSAFEKASGTKIPYAIAPRRDGDIAECYADPTKAFEEIGFKAEFGIDEMCRDSYNWQSKNPNGY